MKTDELMALVKQNLLVNHSEDDSLIASFVLAATSYATAYQHLPEGYYQTEPMSQATHFYESRDGATAGFWADKTDAARAVWNAVNTLLRLDRDWKI